MAVTGARTGASSAYMRRMGQAQGESAVRGLTGVFRKGVANVYNSATASRQGEARYVWELIRNRRHGRYRVFNENMLTLAIRAQARIIYPAPGLGISADPAITIRAEVELVSPIRAEAQILRGAPHVH